MCSYLHIYVQIFPQNLKLAARPLYPFLNGLKRFFSFEDVLGDYVPDTTQSMVKGAAKKKEPEKKDLKKKDAAGKPPKDVKAGEKGGEKGEKKKEDKKRVSGG